MEPMTSASTGGGVPGNQRGRHRARATRTCSPTPLPSTSKATSREPVSVDLDLEEGPGWVCPSIRGSTRRCRSPATEHRRSLSMVTPSARARLAGQRGQYGARAEDQGCAGIGGVSSICRSVTAPRSTRTRRLPGPARSVPASRNRSRPAAGLAVSSGSRTAAAAAGRRRRGRASEAMRTVSVRERSSAASGPVATGPLAELSAAGAGAGSGGCEPSSGGRRARRCRSDRRPPPGPPPRTSCAARRGRCVTCTLRASASSAATRPDGRRPRCRTGRPGRSRRSSGSRRP